MDGDSIFNISDDENSDFVPEKPAPVGSTRSVMVMQNTDSLARAENQGQACSQKGCGCQTQTRGQKGSSEEGCGQEKGQGG